MSSAKCLARKIKEKLQFPTLVCIYRSRIELSIIAFQREFYGMVVFAPFTLLYLHTMFKISHHIVELQKRCAAEGTKLSRTIADDDVVKGDTDYIFPLQSLKFNEPVGSGSCENEI